MNSQKVSDLNRKIKRLEQKFLDLEKDYSCDFEYYIVDPERDLLMLTRRVRDMKRKVDSLEGLLKTLAIKMDEQHNQEAPKKSVNLVDKKRKVEDDKSPAKKLKNEVPTAFHELEGLKDC